MTYDGFCVVLNEDDIFFCEEDVKNRVVKLSQRYECNLGYVQVNGEF